jgi:hypothetical protein
MTTSKDATIDQKNPMSRTESLLLEILNNLMRKAKNTDAVGAHRRQVLYHLNHNSISFCFSYFGERISSSFLNHPGMILLFILST